MPGSLRSNIRGARNLSRGDNALRSTQITLDQSADRANHLHGVRSDNAVIENYEVTDAFFRPEQMIPANAPPTALGAANMYAKPAPPADASKPGRATTTQVSMRALGKRPHNTPVIAPPTFPKRRDKNATAPTTNKPQIANSAIHTRSFVLQMWPPVNARTTSE